MSNKAKKMLQQISVLLNSKQIPEDLKEDINIALETGLDITLRSIAQIIEEKAPELYK